MRQFIEALFILTQRSRKNHEIGMTQRQLDYPTLLREENKFHVQGNIGYHEAF